MTADRAARVEDEIDQGTGRGAVAMQPADRLLDAGLGRRQPAHRPQGQQRRAQGRVAGAQTGELAQHRLGAPGHAAQVADLAPQRVGFQPRRLGAGQERDEPGVEVAVELGGGQAVEHGRQQHQLRRALRTDQPLLAHAQLLRQPQPVARGGGPAGHELEPLVAAHAAEQDGEPAPLVRQGHGGLRETRQARPLADEAMPEPPELLLVFEEGQAHPTLARTSSRSPALTSPSSDSGSISACSIAVGGSIPARISVAA